MHATINTGARMNMNDYKQNRIMTHANIGNLSFYALSPILPLSTRVCLSVCMMSVFFSLALSHVLLPYDNPALSICIYVNLPPPPFSRFTNTRTQFQRSPDFTSDCGLVSYDLSCFIANLFGSACRCRCWWPWHTFFFSFFYSYYLLFCPSLTLFCLSLLLLSFTDCASHLFTFWCIAAVFVSFIINLTPSSLSSTLPLFALLFRSAITLFLFKIFIWVCPWEHETKTFSYLITVPEAPYAYMCWRGVRDCLGSCY